MDLGNGDLTQRLDDLERLGKQSRTKTWVDVVVIAAVVLLLASLAATVWWHTIPITVTAIILIVLPLARYLTRDAAATRLMRQREITNDHAVHLLGSHSRLHAIEQCDQHDRNVSMICRCLGRDRLGRWQGSQARCVCGQELHVDTWKLPGQ